jgi:hypothetical protein
MYNRPLLRSTRENPLEQLPSLALDPLRISALTTEKFVCGVSQSMTVSTTHGSSDEGQYNGRVRTEVITNAGAR